MTVYRYNLETDPEPGPHVRRLRAWSPGLGAGRYADTWTRVPCRRRGGHRFGAIMDRRDRRWARRDGLFWVRKSGARMHRPGKASYMAWGGCSDSEYHYHWTDGDKSRAWGPLRGATVAVDLDAMRRLHTKKRRGWHKK